MHFAEFLKLFDIFALLNFSNFSSSGKFTNVRFSFNIFHLGWKLLLMHVFIRAQKYKKEREKMQDWCRVIFNLENQTISNPPNSRNTFSGLPWTNFIFGKLCKVKLVSGFRFLWWNFACYQLLPWNASSIILLSGRSEEGFLRDKPNLFGNQKFESIYMVHWIGT